MGKFLDAAGLERYTSNVKKLLAGKQDALTGREGQVVGFDAAGRPAAVDGMATREYVDGLLGDIEKALSEI